MNVPLTTAPAVRSGADLLLTRAPELVRGKRIGVLTNHTGRLADGAHLVDVLAEAGIAKVAALFGPEHGIYGDMPDGNAVDHAIHPRYGIPVYSLYGETHKPTPAMLHDIDVVLCDIQDVGARFYTFVSTVAKVMEACAEAGKKFIVLDRPNPIRGLSCDGPVREPSLKCFVALMPIPVTHGLTIGELAAMMNGEGWLDGGVRTDLEVLAMAGWTRSMWFDETGLPWVPPSPNILRLSTATVYPGICFLEGTNISEGRGTASPFEMIGAPWVDSERVIQRATSLGCTGVHLVPVSFVPREIPGIASSPKYAGSECYGIRLEETDRDRIAPVRLGVTLLAAFKMVHPQNTVLRSRRFDILTGSPEVRKGLDAGKSPEEITRAWEPALDAFRRTREKYLLYPDVRPA